VIGLARPLTAEPFLCRDILSGKSTGAKENKSNPALQTGMAIMQIAAISTDQDIPDLSDEATCKKLENILMGKGDEEEKPIKDQEARGYPADENKRS
jgi:hypothetical protein